MENIYLKIFSNIKKENYFYKIFSTRLREQIIQDALKLFLQHGIRSMTMQKLAAAMGISNKTLYKFFADKEALLSECLAIHYTGMFSGMSDLVNAAPNPVEFIWTMYA